MKVINSVFEREEVKLTEMLEMMSTAIPLALDDASVKFYSDSGH